MLGLNPTATSGEKLRMEKAVFLDRDGAIIEDIGYLHEHNKIKFLPRVSEAIRLLNKNEFKVIVITNQSGVARGYFTEEIVKEINRCVQELLAKQGAFVDKIYYCPHHIEGIIPKYKKKCLCRKPSPGMIEEAAREFSIDLKNSFVIGDKISDIEAGHRARCWTILLADKNSPHRDGRDTLMCDYTALDLYEAVKWILNLAVKRSVYESTSSYNV